MSATHSPPSGPVKALFEDALTALWQGRIEDDGFNALVLDAHLTWRQVVVLRAYAKYLRQAGITFRHSNGARGQYQMIETTGSGCALFDYDNDGWLDALLLQSGPLPGATGPRRNGLYHNHGGRGPLRFTDCLWRL